MSCQHETLDGGKCTNPSCDFCLHEVKFGGLCAVCGNVIEDEEESPVDQIKMTHKDIGITVSLNEAKRLEQQDEKRLLEARKLSLIVDLDQTILHATWELSIAEWVKERKETNSNSVNDIKQFTLDGSPLIYSIKLRPGLSDFLKDMSKKYEMHIYTMGTRSYAEAVVKEIDPMGLLFQDRILSRDENGSMTKKRLERLFPSDSSKVVVLDDRGDVWDYTPNLIQIKPYEYFIGIGDINSPFAQPKKDIIPSVESLQSSKTTNVNKPIPADIENVNELPRVNGNDTRDDSSKENIDTNNHNKDDSGKDDHKKDNHKKDDSDKNDSKKEDSDENNTNEQETVKEDTSPTEEKEDIYSDTEDDEENSPKVSENTPKDDAVFKVPANFEKTDTHLPKTHDTDDILRVIRKSLFDVHNIYFNDLIKRNQKPDVAIILNSLKRKVLKGVNVVFSGIIPLHQTRPEDSWIWRMATSFGANCFHELTGKVTHLIAANPGTDKALTARKHGNIKIVSPAWITDSVWNWERLNESDYLLPIADMTPPEPEIEDPESTLLEIEFDWEDDEVDEALGDESDDDSEEESEVNSNLNNHTQPNLNNVDVPSIPAPILDNDDDEIDDDELFRADMDAVLGDDIDDMLASDDDEMLASYDDDLEFSENDADEDGILGKRDKDNEVEDNEDEYPAKRQR